MQVSDHKLHRDKANSKLFAACLPNGTAYSSQMANPATEAAILQLPETRRDGKEQEQRRQDTEQL